LQTTHEVDVGFWGREWLRAIVMFCRLEIQVAATSRQGKAIRVV